MRLNVTPIDYVSKVLGSEAFKSFVAKYNLISNVILAMLTIFAIIALAINIARLSAAGDNPQKRSLAQHGIMIAFICFAVIGGIDVVYATVLGLFFAGSGA